MEKKRLAHIREEFLEGIGVPEGGNFSPDPFQLEAIDSLKNGFDTLVVAPTGAGKTFIASEGIRAVVEAGKRAVYTAPLKALSNAKYAEFKTRFEPKHSVGLLTGDRKIGGDASIVVATTEIYRNELYRSSDNYALVVLDELHYLADSQRGAVWEESIILSPRTSALLMLSASISNPQEIAAWIEEIRGKKVTIVRVTERPVELRFGFLHPEKGILPIEDEQERVLPEVARFYSAEREGDPRMRFGGKGRGRGRRGGRR
ncbi:MAG: DEAD/DEAH box helicase [Deltaproteobacteria bacterium]|nr:DEAD/DEAH box helicase [Deltaproteobacteria bacterium]